MSQQRFYDQTTIDFFVLIAVIVVRWGRIERSIDITLSAGKLFIPKHFKDGPPVALKRKIRAYRALSALLPSLANNLQWVYERLDDVLDMAEYRHTIIHGFFHGISNEREPQIYFRRAPPLTGESGDRVIATRAELDAFVQKLENAEEDLIVLMNTAIQDVRKKRHEVSK
jgi:hypothetical protein